MKKTLLLLTAASLFLAAQPSSRAAVSATATPSSQNVSIGGTFTISLSLTVTNPPANVTGYDLYLTTAAGNSGYFRITAATPSAGSPFTAFGPDNSTADPLSTGAAAGFVRNGRDQGYSGTTQTAPFTNLALETLTLSVGANVPTGTYTFQTSTSTTAPGFFSRVSDSGGNTYEITNPGMFSITVVPEPSTWALGLLGAAATGMVAVRRRARRLA